MTAARTLGRTLAYGVAFVVAGYLARFTVVPGAALALIWPAAGVASVWLARSRGRSRWLDDVVLLVGAAGVNLATGASPLLAAFLACANLVQALVFVAVLRALAPRMWLVGGDLPMRRIVALGQLTLAAAAGSLAGAATGTAGFWVSGGSWPWETAGAWVVRTTVSVLVLAAAAQQAGSWWQARRPRPGGPARGEDDENVAEGPSSRTSARLAVLESPLVVLVTVVTVWAVFAAGHVLPLGFVPLALTVWVGARHRVEVSLVHTAIVSTLVIALTVAGAGGAFGAIDDLWVQALVVQAYVGVTAFVGMALSLVREENAEMTRRLAAARHEAAEQAGLLRTIIDTMHEGLVVIRADGSVMLHNPAADRLTGGVAPGWNTISTADLYGLFEPDGTPLTETALPHVRALGGETVAGQDLVIRNSAIPDGAVLDVVATPMALREDDPPMAVVVFRDVTADRRQREELTSFAGAVAHDLLSPLTTVEGWSEALREELDEGRCGGRVDVASAAGSLDRIDRGARRMRDFINDLLAYTTARDAELHPTPVRLDEAAADVALSRTEGWAGAGAAPVVTVDIDPSADVVEAEPVLLRQLLDNLVGNSVKYVAPGVVPHVRVSATPLADGFVEVAVLDNGTGIPDGQHERVFERFFRAHAAAYRGTGLGLAICRRIVERHGGTIAAGPRPDGGSGTVVSFTIPAGRVDPVTVGDRPARGAQPRTRESTSRATSPGRVSGSQWPASSSTNR